MSRTRITIGLAAASVVAVAASVGAFGGAAGATAPVSACGAGITPVVAGGTTTCTYGYTDAEQTFVVPAGVTSLNVTAVGAAAGPAGLPPGFSEPGGAGASATGTVPVTPGHTLYVEVGGDASGANEGSYGFDGGGWDGGGGASDVRTVSIGSYAPVFDGQPDADNPYGSNWAAGLTSRLLVAGGGGGGSSCGPKSGCLTLGGAGGAGGQNGGDAQVSSFSGGAGGLAGENRTDVSGNGAGGDGEVGGFDFAFSAGGGGGYTGGGSGQIVNLAGTSYCAPDEFRCAGGSSGAGGGSSFANGHEIAGTPVSLTTPASVTISYATPGTGTGTGPANVLQFSTSADRSAPTSLDGSTVSGPIYVFANAPTTDRSVAFTLDGKAFHSETSAPFDFNGTVTATSATALATASLAPGPHTIGATLTSGTGAVSTATATFTVTAPPAASTPLRVSINANRSAPFDLNGQFLEGTVYIFDVPTSAAKQVAFSLDGKAFHTEATAPYDFNSSGVTDALPYSTSGLTLGKHTVTAVTTLTNGTTTTQTATFTVS